MAISEPLGGAAVDPADWQFDARRRRVNENDVTKRVGAELREATRQLVNDVVPQSMLVSLAELQAAEQSRDRFERGDTAHHEGARRR
jgi:hypothetical protein